MVLNMTYAGIYRQNGKVSTDVHVLVRLVDDAAVPIPVPPNASSQLRTPEPASDVILDVLNILNYILKALGEYRPPARGPAAGSMRRPRQCRGRGY